VNACVFGKRKITRAKASIAATNTHIAVEIAIAICRCCALRRFKNVLQNSVNQTFHGYKFIFPGVFTGPGIGTFSTLEGCQRVIEPDLSPLLYKSKPLRGDDYGIATEYYFKDKGIFSNLPNFISFLGAES